MGKRQTEIPGTETPELPAELKDITMEYKRVQRRRMKALAREVDLKDQIIAKMHELQLGHILDEEEDVELELVAGKERLKVRTPSEEDEDEGE